MHLSPLNSAGEAALLQEMDAVRDLIAGMNGLLGQHGHVLGAEIAPRRSDITWQS